MDTTHQILVGDARSLGMIPDQSVHLVVTSPPYPMVAMWDTLFSQLSPEIGATLAAGDGFAAFEQMHRLLDPVWQDCARVLVPGGLLCINIGDAVRSFEQFALYPNHARVLLGAARFGLVPLPDVLWRKPNNSPNKFMGSGMLPAGAYVTYEHEYVLVLRNGPPRAFRTEAERQLRRRSAFFWEERNQWFTDLWTDIVGARQELPSPTLRARSAAFPLEIPLRLIQMYSCLGDTVLDPFAGTGTTSLAAAVLARSSIGVDLDPQLVDVGRASLRDVVPVGRAIAAERLELHRRFVARRLASGKAVGYHLVGLDVPVMTRQETSLEIWSPRAVRMESPERIVVEHQPIEPGTGALWGLGAPS